jgi:hypothetical protein
MPKRSSLPQFIIVLPAPPLFPLHQAHEMTHEMHEDLKPRRKKKKHGGPVPGFASGGRADRAPRRRQLGGAALLGGLGEAAEAAAPSFLSRAGPFVADMADDVAAAGMRKVVKGAKHVGKKIKESFEDDDECDDESDDPEEHCDKEEKRRGGRAR